MPRFVLNCRPTGGASKRYLWVEKLLKESEKYLLLYAILKLIYDFNIFVYFFVQKRLNQLFCFLS